MKNKALLRKVTDYNKFTKYLQLQCGVVPQYVRLRNDAVVRIINGVNGLGFSDIDCSRLWNPDGSSITSHVYDIIELLDV
jgi:hypothetical protein